MAWPRNRRRPCVAGWNQEPSEIPGNVEPVIRLTIALLGALTHLSIDVVPGLSIASGRGSGIRARVSECSFVSCSHSGRCCPLEHRCRHTCRGHYSAVRRRSRRPQSSRSLSAPDGSRGPLHRNVPHGLRRRPAGGGRSWCGLLEALLILARIADHNGVRHHPQTPLRPDRQCGGRREHARRPPPVSLTGICCPTWWPARSGPIRRRRTSSSIGPNRTIQAWLGADGAYQVESAARAAPVALRVPDRGMPSGSWRSLCGRGDRRRELAERGGLVVSRRRSRRRGGASMEPRSVSLQSEHCDDGSQLTMTAERRADGQLEILGQDLGPVTRSISGDGEYGWGYTVAADDVPALVIALGGGRPARTSSMSSNGGGRARTSTDSGRRSAQAACPMSSGTATAVNSCSGRPVVP